MASDTVIDIACTHKSETPEKGGEVTGLNEEGVQTLKAMLARGVDVLQDVFHQAFLGCVGGGLLTITQV